MGPIQFNPSIRRDRTNLPSPIALRRYFLSILPRAPQPTTELKGKYFTTCQHLLDEAVEVVRGSAAFDPALVQLRIETTLEKISEGDAEVSGSDLNQCAAALRAALAAVKVIATRSATPLDPTELWDRLEDANFDAWNSVVQRAQGGYLSHAVRKFEQYCRGQLLCVVVPHPQDILRGA